MKIQCDVCSKKEASVFCSADEAALCDGCDQRVHHANKLASKHERFSLLHPSSSLFPLCDICKEKKALVFCQQDRAILCRDCEVPLHRANEHTQKHNRFLLTGIRLSALISNATIKHNNNKNSSNNKNNEWDQVPDHFNSAKENPIISPEIHSSSESAVSNSSTTNLLNCVVDDDKLVSGGGSTSSISEYLVEMLPGWHFEDFLLDSSSFASPSPFGFCKNGNNIDFEANGDALSFFDVDLEKKLTSSSTNQSENLGMWVPQAPPPPPAVTTNFVPTNFVHPSIFKQQENSSVTAMKENNRKWRDDGFTVPQISQSVGSKRTCPFW